MQDKLLNNEEATPAEQTSNEIAPEAAAQDDIQAPESAPEANDTAEAVTAADADSTDSQPQVQEASEQTAAGAAAPAEATDEAQPTAPVFEQPVFTPQNVYQPQPVTYKKKSAGKKIIAVLSVLAALILIGAGTAYALFPNQVKRTIMGNEKYFVYVESKNMKKETDSAVDMLSTALKSASLVQDSAVNAKLSFFVDPQQLGLPELEMLTDILNKCQIDINSNYKKDVGSSGDIKLLFENDTVLTMELYESDDKTFIKIPELSDKYIIVPDPRNQYFTGSLTSSSMMYYNILYSDIEFDEAKLKKSLRSLIDVIVNNMGEVEITSETLTIGDMTQKVDVMTVEFDQESFYKLSIKALEQIKKDDYLKELITANSEKLFGLEIDKDNIEKGLDEMIEELESALENPSEDGTLTYQSFADSKGNIVGRRIRFSDDYSEQTIEYFDLADKADRETVFKVNFDGIDMLSLSNKSTLSNGKYTGNLEINSYGQKLFAIKYNDLLLDDDNLTGTVQLTDIMGLPYTIKLEATADTAELSINGSGKIASIKVTAKELTPQNIQIPELTDDNSVSLEDPFEAMEWAETLDIEAFAFETLGKLGLSEDEIQELLSLFFQGTYPDEYYYEDYNFEDFNFDEYDFENMSLSKK